MWCLLYMHFQSEDGTKSSYYNSMGLGADSMLCVHSVSRGGATGPAGPVLALPIFDRAGSATSRTVQLGLTQARAELYHTAEL